MPAHGRHACGLEARKAGADDEHGARLGRGGEVAEFRLVAHRGVLHAADRELAQAPRDAQVVADAGADAGGLAVARVTQHERVGEQRARHPDEVAGAVRERLLADLGPVDASFCEDRELGHGAFRARRERHAVARLELHRRHDQVRHLVVAVPDAGIVDVAARGQVRDGLLVARPSRP